MSATVSYWKEVYSERDRIVREHGPAVFIVSLRPPYGTQTTQGAVCEVTALLAAQRFVERSHEMATPQQIQSFRDAQEDSRKLTESIERRGSKRRTVTE